MSRISLSAEMAAADLTKLDPEETARRAGAFFDSGRRILTLRFMGEPVSFDYGRSKLIRGGSGEDFDPTASIAVLHYLLKARGDRPTGQLVAYRDLWGAGAQSGPFIDRPEKLLAEKFEENPALIVERAGALGAEITEKYGDVRLDVPVLPNLPLTVLLYAPDEELPAGAKILYDAVTEFYLPTEDAAWLAEYTAERLTSQS